MSKNKEKHHLTEEVKKDVPLPEQAVAPGKDASPPAEKHPKAELESPEEKLQKAEQEIAGLKDQLLRLRADYDNFRKRALREKGEIYENANETLMLELLPVLDHLQLALRLRSGQAAQSDSTDALSASSPQACSGQAHSTGSASSPQACSGQAFQEGIQMICDQLMDTLAKYGLDPFNADKEPFDPKLHEAISALPSATEPEGVVIAQSRRGYRFKSKLLRPAQVVVSSGQPKAEQPQPTETQPAEE